MARYQLLESARAIADANGTAVASIGPLRAFEKWRVTHVAVQSTSTTLVPELREYRGALTETRLIGSSYTGNLDSGPADISLQAGEKLIYEWRNCDVGSRCVVTLQGEIFR